ncbi:DUF4127 family protein [Jiangella aurantiaca]|uniref:DUF4127 family protein n=1 Tax=Jiangella aurantiaca TaxID=2530373 RepID=A0A4R5AI68_9ACTN|nr:DUF4127 family protein [Jiangella aurantiaca]TDD70654.1 DUF4127 family protein [Jiangella aurantiaca]
MTRNTTFTVALLPLDDRPVNTSHVAALVRAGGARLLLPPAALLPSKGVPGDTDRLAGWLVDAAGESDALVVSVNQLAYGGYVASRRTTHRVDHAFAALDILRGIRADHRQLPIAAYVTVMRTKDADDAGAEPEYWARHGRQFFTLSGELWRAEHGQESRVEQAVAPIPRAHVTDFFARRLRQHALHLGCLDLVVDGVVDRMAIAVEDSAVEGVSTSEREWLQAWVRRLGLGDRVRCYPGADEVAAVLTTRALLEHAGRQPNVAVVCADESGLDRVARYEDVPVRQTIADQLSMAGVAVTGDVAAADLVLAVHPPHHDARDWYRWPLPDGQPETAGAARLAARVHELVTAGRPVTVADVADANGADPSLVAALRSRGVLDRLAGYAGWNTAGNTIGSAIAQGSMRLLTTCPEQLAEHSRTVAHRFLEDWGYQSSARGTVLASANAADTADPLQAAMVPLQAATVAGLLADRLADLGPLARRFRLVPHSVRFPWDRPFEIDFELKQRADWVDPQ